MKQKKRNKRKIFGVVFAFIMLFNVLFYSTGTYASSGAEEDPGETTEETEFQLPTEEIEETSENAVFYAEIVTEPENTVEMPTRGYAQGVGSTGNVIITTNDLSGSLEFIPFTTKDGQQFYLLIDYSQSENNVYLLDVVTFNDLAHMAETATDADGNPIEYVPPVKQTEAQEKETTKATEKSTDSETEENPQKGSGNNLRDSNVVLLLGIGIIIALAVVGMTFYKKKTKKIDEDNDEFDLDNDEEDEDDTEEDVFSNASDTQEQERQNLFDIEFMDDEKGTSDPETNDGIEFIDEPEDEQY